MKLHHAGFALALLALVACGSGAGGRRVEGLDPNALPEDIRGDYAVFADRCSKCHSLSRPLNSGIDTDEYWQKYVAKMRRQSGSGISQGDSTQILRFLHYLVVRDKERDNGEGAKTSPPAPTSSPAPNSTTSPSPGETAPPSKSDGGVPPVDPQPSISEPRPARPAPRVASGASVERARQRAHELPRFHEVSPSAAGAIVTMTRALALAVLMALVLALSPRAAMAVDRTFAGSLQSDYFFVPTSPQANARGIGFDGFTTEAALKVAVDVTDHFSATAKLCYGCHGFETDSFYLEYRVSDEAGIKVGKFSPSFGSFNLRHNPANHSLSSKPLAYDMGRMLRASAWNQGVLPSPFPDNGIEFSGTHWFGERVQLDYAAYLVSGFKAENQATDLDFIQNRSLYYVDNNGRPTGGARLALTAKLSPGLDATLGASGMYGTYDPANKQTYAIVGSDFSMRYGSTSFRAEYLARRQTFDTSDPTGFKYAIAPDGGNFFVKHGAFAELEQGIGGRLALIARADGLLRQGNVSARSPLFDGSHVLRGTIGAIVTIERGIRLKVSTETYKFSSRDDDGQRWALGIHLGAVGTF